MIAIWNDVVIAESDETVIVERNHYFPRSALREECFEPSETTTQCHWKGTAHYLTVVIDGDRNVDAAWYYPEPFEAAAEITDRVAFWKGVRVEEGSSAG